MYGNPYNNTFSGFNQQITTPDQNYLSMLENEKNKIEKMKENYLNRFQTQQPTLNQTIQVTPSNSNIGIKYVNSEEDVKKELVFTDTPFILNDYSKLFIKNLKGEVRTFKMEEEKPKDEKDELIQKLTEENEKLKGMISNEPTNERNDETINRKFDERIDEPSTSDVSISKSSKNKSK